MEIRKDGENNAVQTGPELQNRRLFLKKSGMLAAGLLTAPELFKAQGLSSVDDSEKNDASQVESQNELMSKNMHEMKNHKIITIEEHFIISEISAQVTAFNQRMGKITPQGAAIQKDLMKIVLPTSDDILDVGEGRIKFMDRAGINMQVLSYGANSPQNVSDKELAINLCREANNKLAALIARNPSRFSGFAVLPMADPLAAANELERAVNELGLKGAMLSGTLEGVFFDDAVFFPVLQKASALAVPIYMHPAIIDPKVAGYYYQSKDWSAAAGAMFAGAGYGWHMDSGIGIIRMILSGMFDKLPHLQLISGHWGEMVPFYLNRLDDQLGKTVTLERKISDYYKSNIHITPAGLFTNSQLEYAVAELGADRILYSGDYPFLIDQNTRGFLENAPISDSDKLKIGCTNAERLLKI